MGDLNALAVFIKVAELRSFRAAAKALALPKSTVSVKVARLEDELGARLLERTTRTLRLTDAGHAYYLQASPAFAALRDAEQAIHKLKAKPTGKLRITTAFELGQSASMFGEALAEYAERYPEVAVEVDLTDRRVDLVEEGFDLAIRAGALSDSTLVARRLGAGGSWRVYGSPTYLRRRGVPRQPLDLRTHACLVMSAQSQPLLWHFRGKRKPLTVEVQPRLVANSFVVLRNLALSGLGLVRLPEYLGAEALKAGTLRSVLDDFALSPIFWHALYPSARHLAPKVRAFLDLLEEKFG